MLALPLPLSFYDVAPRESENDAILFRVNSRQRCCVPQHPTRDADKRLTIGCVPKKIMWYAADIADKIRHAEGYQFKGPGIGQPQFDWKSFKPQRDAYIRRLNGIYDNNRSEDTRLNSSHSGESRMPSSA